MKRNKVGIGDTSSCIIPSFSFTHSHIPSLIYSYNTHHMNICDPLVMFFAATVNIMMGLVTVVVTIVVGKVPALFVFVITAAVEAGIVVGVEVVAVTGTTIGAVIGAEKVSATSLPLPPSSPSSW